MTALETALVLLSLVRLSMAYCEDELPQDYSTDCSNSLNNAIRLHHGKHKLAQSLGTFCTAECREPLEGLHQYYRCLGDRDVVSFLKYAACAVNGEEFCVDVIHRSNDALYQLQKCSSSCTADCILALHDAVNKLGCCAASNFRHGLYFTSLAYDKCNVDVGQECKMVGIKDSANSAGIIAPASLVTIAMVAAVACFIA